MEIEAYGRKGSFGFNDEEQLLVMWLDTRYFKPCLRDERKRVPVQMTSTRQALPQGCQPILQPSDQWVMDPHMLKKQHLPCGLTDAPHLAQRLTRIRNRTAH